jgi:hypothetical protein
VYTAALAMLGRDYPGAGLVAGSTVFSVGYTIGGTSGLAAAGIAMNAMGYQAAPLALAALFGLVAIVVLLNRR